MRAQALHNNRCRQHADDLQQRPGRKNLTKQRHVMLSVMPAYNI